MPVSASGETIPTLLRAALAKKLNKHMWVVHGEPLRLVRIRRMGLGLFDMVGNVWEWTNDWYLDVNAAPAAAADAAKLQSLFKDTEDFWAQFKTKDALDAARGAQDAAGAIVADAKANSMQKAQVSYNGVGKFCNACHTSHREQMPDKSYKIKP